MALPRQSGLSGFIWRATGIIILEHFSALAIFGVSGQSLTKQMQAFRNGAFEMLQLVALSSQSGLSRLI